MQSRHLFLVSLFVAFSLQAQPVQGPTPIYEESFNLLHSRVEYRNGGGLGGPGTGVSGKSGDRAYIGVPRSTEQEPNGPAAMAIAPIAPERLAAFSCTFWYYLDEQGADLQVPLSTAGVLFLLNEKGLEVRIETQSEQPRSQNFTPGPQGPLLAWRERNRWIFAAVSWSRLSNTLTVHQGTPEAAVAFMRAQSRTAPAQLSLPRTDLARDPETIGNTAKKLDRPLAGRLDNLRFFDCELTRDELEKIRQADIANAAVRL